jgi:hypothetical protein
LGPGFAINKSEYHSIDNKEVFNKNVSRSIFFNLVPRDEKKDLGSNENFGTIL